MRLLHAIHEDSAELTHRALNKVYDPKDGLFIKLNENAIRPAHARIAFDGALCASANSKKVAHVLEYEFSMIAKACFVEDKDIEALIACVQDVRDVCSLGDAERHTACTRVASKSGAVFPYTVRKVMRIVAGLDTFREG